MERFERTLDNRTVKIYKQGKEGLPVIYLNDYGDSGEDLLEQCEEGLCRPFNLVTISGFDWEEDLTPWAAGDIVSDDDNFAGKASEHLTWMLERVRPYVEEILGEINSVSYISGFSLAGLFALWSLYQTDVFYGAVCVSGSLWYPGFKAYAMKYEIKRQPSRVYFSIGGKESNTDHPEFKKTEGVFRELNEYYKAERKICPIFQLNAGGHFKDTEERLVKGFHWILQEEICGLEF